MLYKSGVDEFIDDCYIPASMGGSSSYVLNVNELNDVVPEGETSSIETTNVDTNTLRIDANTNDDDDDINRIQKEIESICVSDSDATTTTTTNTNNYNNDDDNVTNN